MRIDVRTGNVVYIEIEGWTYYIDNSTNEQIIDKWITYKHGFENYKKGETKWIIIIGFSKI